MGIYPPKNGLSLCAGAGGLDMGLLLAEPGFHTRCFVEWEPEPRACLIAAQRAGYFEPAPIWTDLKTFDGRPWRGIIDTVLAGYPCQPFSAAGQRKGADDPRHLWPDVARVVREIQPGWVFLENVAGHLSLGAEAVIRELWSMGWTPAVGVFSAAETGATHRRDRWFCVAYKQSGVRRERGLPSQPRGCGHIDGGSDAVAYAHGGNASAEREQPSREQPSREQRLYAEGSGTLDDAASARRDAARIGPEANRESRERMLGDGREDVDDAGSRRCQEHTEQHIKEPGQPAHGDDSGHVMRSDHNMADAGSLRGCEGPAVRSEAKPPKKRERGGRWAESCNRGNDVADASGAGSQGNEQPGSPRERNRTIAPRSASERSRVPLFPPGPSDAAAWLSVIAADPSSAPAFTRRDVATAAIRAASVFTSEQATAFERRTRGMASQDVIRALELEASKMVEGREAIAGFCRLADGLAQRTRALRILGNGVVPIQAAHAWRTLATAHGLRPLDLEAADTDETT